MILERSLKILKDVIDVMVQTKRLMENTTHHDANIKRFKEMVRTLKDKKNSQKQRFGFKDFPISKDFDPYLVVKVWDHRRQTSPLNNWWH
jgi:hypothetical protein